MSLGRLYEYNYDTVAENAGSSASVYQAIMPNWHSSMVNSKKLIQIQTCVSAVKTSVMLVCDYLMSLYCSEAGI